MDFKSFIVEEPSKKKEKYFVPSSDGESPDCITFAKEDAFKSPGARYVDSFDVKGKKVNTYKYINGGWTDNF